MDPNANLREQEEIEAERRPDGTLHNYDRYRLHDLRVALRDWIRGGGFAPDWAQCPTAAASFQKWSGQRRSARSTFSRGMGC